MKHVPKVVTAHMKVTIKLTELVSKVAGHMTGYLKKQEITEYYLNLHKNANDVKELEEVLKQVTDPRLAEILREIQKEVKKAQGERGL